PQDLDLSMHRVPSTAPNSAAWTSLTSPLIDSPLDSFEASPLFPTDGLDGPENWEPLFPESIGMEPCLSREGVFVNPVEAETRKSRARRVEKFEEMERKIEELESEVEHWKRLAQGNA